MNFDLPFLPERAAKPRENGLTMVMDKGLSLRQAEDLIEASGHLIDIIKLGFGTSIVSNNLQEKIRFYQQHNIKVYLGGTLFEAFVVRDRFDDFRSFVSSLGLDTVEVSDGSIDLSIDRKCELIRTLAQDYTVLSEVGSKEQGIVISPEQWIKLMQTELSAGSWKVIAEARESGNVGIYRPNGTAHSTLINSIIEAVPAEDILWEAPQKSQQVWFIKLLGANVNLGNIGPADVIPQECLRLGLRGDTFFTFLPEHLQETKKKSTES